MNAAGIELVEIHPQDRLDEGIDLNRLRRLRLPVEAQGLPGDVRDALDLQLSQCEVLHNRGRGRRVRLGDVDEIDHCFERIVDLMGHGGREVRRGCQLLSSAKKVLRFALCRDVAKDEHDANELVAVIADRRCAAFNGNEPSVGVLEGSMVSKPDHAAEFHHFADRIFSGFAAELVEDGEDASNVFAGGLCRADAGERFGHRIDEGDKSSAVGGDDRIANAGKRDAEPLLAGANLLRVPLAEPALPDDEVGKNQEPENAYKSSEDDADLRKANAAP